MKITLLKNFLNTIKKNFVFLIISCRKFYIGAKIKNKIKFFMIIDLLNYMKEKCSVFLVKKEDGGNFKDLYCSEKPLMYEP